MTLAGLISDTHGLLRPQVAAALSGVSRILHAGDIGKPEILDALALIAPVTAVRGNNDSGTWAMELPLWTTFAIEGHTVHMRHIPDEFDPDPPPESARRGDMGPYAQAADRKARRRSLRQSRQRRAAPVLQSHLHRFPAAFGKQAPGVVAANLRSLMRCRSISGSAPVPHKSRIRSANPLRRLVNAMEGRYRACVAASTATARSGRVSG